MIKITCMASLKEKLKFLTVSTEFGIWDTDEYNDVYVELDMNNARKMILSLALEGITMYIVRGNSEEINQIKDFLISLVYNLGAMATVRNN